MSLSVSFWGTRGSIPTPGRATTRYGGNTSCLAVQHPGGVLILDAGTGLRGLGRALDSSPSPPSAVRLLLSHTHWDHIQGFPFFRPLFRPGARVSVYGPPQPSGSLEMVLREQMEPPFFPVQLSDARAVVAVHEISTPTLEMDSLAIECISAFHPAPTLGFSITSQAGGPRLIYLTDNELESVAAAVERPRLVRFLRDADLLVHDAMYFEAEQRARRGFGHSSAVQAVRVALEAGCRRLALFHHDPDHDDETLDRLLAEAIGERDRIGGQLDIALAAEGTTVGLED